MRGWGEEKGKEEGRVAIDIKLGNFNDKECNEIL